MIESKQQAVLDSDDLFSLLRAEEIPGRLLIEINEGDEYSRLRNYAHYLRRAVEDEDLKIRAIYCFDGRPTIYFKEVEFFDSEVELRAQRALWNQGVATLLVVSDPRQVRVYSAFVPVVESTTLAQKNPKFRAKTKVVEPPSAQGLSSAQIESLERATFALEIEGWLRRIESGQFYREHEAKFQKESAVDRQLLRNLRAASNALHGGQGGLSRRTAHALLSRVLFVCYLCDRHVVTGDYMKGKFQVVNASNLLSLLESKATWEEQKDSLYALFGALQEDFNGSLLNDDLQAEYELVESQHVNVLLALLRGDEIASGQRSLFPYYNFKWIPIETISALYENFLALEKSSDKESKAGDGKEVTGRNQSQDGAYYTPRHLAEMAVDSATREWTTFLDKRCLDPACGSGIFLVILFNRMAEEWHRKNPQSPNLERALAFRKLLTTQLCGVDLEATSCRITCFSLYLAFFDRLTPPDIWTLQNTLGKRGEDLLPPLLQTPQHRLALGKIEEKEVSPVPETSHPAIYEANFFDTNTLFGLGPLGEFDLVIGNPPWTGRNHSPDLEAKKWLDSTANVFRRAVSARQRNSTFFPQRQNAIAFMWKVPLHLKEGGRACLILPSKIFLSETDDFQAAWLKHFSVERVVQLADYSFLLFENALCPTSIVTFRSTPPESGRDVIWYDVPKFERRDPRHAVISVWPEDQQWIRVGEIIEAAIAGEAALVWKKWLWGRSRDVRLLKQLREWQTLGDLADEPGKNKRWVKGQGFKPFHVESYNKNPDIYGEPRSPNWFADSKYLNTRSSDVDLFLQSSDFESVGERFNQLHRSPDARIFTPPMVVFNTGFSKFAFCDFNVTFQHSLQSISASQDDVALLMFLSGVLNSPLSTYFLFHTSANWGVERDVVRLNEFLRLPFALPEDHPHPEQAQKIVDQVANIILRAREQSANNFMTHEQSVSIAKSAIEPLIYEYYGLSFEEIALVEDTVNVFEPSSTPSTFYTHVETKRTPSSVELEIYANWLCNTLNSWIFDSPFKISGQVITSIQFEMGAIVLTKHLKSVDETRHYTEVEAPEKINEILGRLKKVLRQPDQSLSYVRGFVLFEQDVAFVVKPLHLRSWTRSAALHDADELIGYFLQNK